MFLLLLAVIVALGLASYFDHVENMARIANKSNRAASPTTEKGKPGDTEGR